MAVSAADKKIIEELADRMLRVLESQRPLGGGAYPPTLRGLARLCDLNESDPKVLKAVGKDAFKNHAIVAWTKDRKPDRDAFVFLANKDAIDEAVEEVAPVLLLALLRRQAETKTHALNVTKLRDKLTERIKKPFQTVIRRQIENQSLPEGVAWVLMGNSGEVLFLTSVLQPSSIREVIGAKAPTPLQPIPDRMIPKAEQAPSPVNSSSNGGGMRATEAPSRDFSTAFDEAFDRLDRRNGGTNYVTLADLRRELSSFDRDRFDAGLKQLRVEQRYSLDAHDGRHRPPSDEERAAGIREAGSLLIYVSRRQ